MPLIKLAQIREYFEIGHRNDLSLIVRKSGLDRKDPHFTIKLIEYLSLKQENPASLLTLDSSKEQTLSIEVRVKRVEQQNLDEEETTFSLKRL